jgi:hypothetical protein
MQAIMTTHGISPERLAGINERIWEETLEEHKLFSEAFKAGQCYLCGDALTKFDRAKPYPGKVRRLLPGGAGMNDALDEDMLGQHLDRMKPSEEMESALVKFRTNIVAEPGKKISGDDLYHLIQAAKAEGVTAASKMHELKDASILTLVFPGPSVARQATRSGRNRRGDRQLRAQDRAWREQQKRRY